MNNRTDKLVLLLCCAALALMMSHSASAQISIEEAILAEVPPSTTSRSTAWR